jgi:peroxiredoxin
MGHPMKLSTAILAAALAIASGCASNPTPATPDAAALTSVDGSARAYRELVGAAPLTVFVFVSADCPCLDAHLDRLRSIASAYGTRGVQFLAVDSEVGASTERASAEATRFALPFPVVIDPGAKLANAFGAMYATYTVVVDRDGTVRYRGGIDSDKRKLHDGTIPYLRDALDDLLAGKPPRRAEGKTLGCVLRKW